MGPGRISNVFDFLRQSHPRIAAIIESVFNLVAFGLLGYATFMFLRRRFRVHQFSVYRKLLKRIYGKQARRKIAVIKR